MLIVINKCIFWCQNSINRNQLNSSMFQLNTRAVQTQRILRPLSPVPAILGIKQLNRNIVTLLSIPISIEFYWDCIQCVVFTNEMPTLRTH